MIHDRSKLSYKCGGLVTASCQTHASPPVMNEQSRSSPLLSPSHTSWYRGGKGPYRLRGIRRRSDQSPHRVCSVRRM